MTQYPPIQVVDENDKPIRGADMHEAHAKGLIHRIVYIFVEDGQGNILLQKRSSQVATYPNTWDVSAAGHVDEGEDYKTAALRELREELGVTAQDIYEVGEFYDETTIGDRQLNRFCHVYKTVVAKNIEFVLELSEVSEVKWFSLAEVLELVGKYPESVAAGLGDCAERFYKSENHEH